MRFKIGVAPGGVRGGGKLFESRRAAVARPLLGAFAFLAPEADDERLYLCPCRPRRLDHRLCRLSGAD